MRYYKSTIARGHVGSGNHNALITFYYRCNNMIEAMDLAKKQGGVKHSQIPKVVEISKAEYDREIKENAYRRAGAKL